MCLLIVAYRVDSEAPILVAANREERFDRPTLSPHVQPGPPRVLCGIDEQAGGTWLGVNEHGLLVAVTNRVKSSVPAAPRSRGALCRELLACPSADVAAALAVDELSRDLYAGANYLCLDETRGAVIHAGDRLEALHVEPGVHFMTNGDLDDPGDRRLELARRLFRPAQSPTSPPAAPPTDAVEFIAVTAQICGHPEIVVRGPDGGTVSSDQVALTARRDRAVYRHAPGPPDRQAYEDLSDRLRQVLAGSVEAVE